MKDLNANVDYLQRLLNQKPDRDTLPHRGVDTARFILEGVHLVLVSPTNEDGEPAKILRERGEGLFLLSLATSSIEDTLNYLESQDIHALSDKRNGLMNWTVLDLQTPGGLGPVLQLCEEKP